MKHGFYFGWLAFFFIGSCASFEIGREIQSGRTALLKGEPQVALPPFERAAKAEPGYITDFTILQQSVWTYVGRAQYALGKWTEARAAFERALSHFKTDSLAKLYLGLTIIRQTQEPAEKPFSLDDVVYALKEGVGSKRVAALVRERGIEFDVAGETETVLRKAGADQPLIEEMKKTRLAGTRLRRENDLQRERALKDTASAMQELHQWLERISTSTLDGKYWDPAGAIRTRIQSTVALISAKDRDWKRILSGGEWVGEKLEEEIDSARRDRQRDMHMPRTP